MNNLGKFKNTFIDRYIHGKMRIAVSVLMCLVMSISMTGCGSDQGSDVQIDMKAVVEEMKATDTEMPETTMVDETSESAEETFSVLCDFDYSKIEKFVYLYSETGSPEEVAVILCREKASVGDLMKALQTHIDKRRATFEQYSPEEVAVVENAVLTFEGKYVLLAIAPKSGAMQDIFKSKF
ncbi:MAG: DUF4358 domain-containing protein [Eubacterium sp.]|nr:DUF4358 domain-containing protein [Eubacterium sp.]